MVLYAAGAKARGICQQCGLDFMLSALIEDGQYPGLKVCRSCYDIKHPQEQPVDVTDVTALRRPSPNVDKVPMSVALPTAELWGSPLSFHQIGVEMGVFGIDVAESTVILDGAFIRPDVITFTRASTKTYFDEDGVLQTADVDEWPVEYGEEA